MKKIGFLSFGHWSPSPSSQTRSAADALLQSIELSVAAEDLGADGAYFRVHHFARQLASPFPLLAAVGAKTRRIEIGTAVIDMRYENPLYMAEDAGAADLIAGGRLQLGISRGSPEQVIDGFRYFGYAPAEGMSDADMARRHIEVFLEAVKGEGFDVSAGRGNPVHLLLSGSQLHERASRAPCAAPAPRSRHRSRRWFRMSRRNSDIRSCADSGRLRCPASSGSGWWAGRSAGRAGCRKIADREAGVSFSARRPRWNGMMQAKARPVSQPPAPTQYAYR